MTDDVTDELCEVILTAPDPEWMIAFTRRLVDDRLAASAHNLSEGRSVYRWQNEIIERSEACATVRTRTSLVPRIAARLDHEHPYEVPGIIAVPVVASSPAYTAWLLAQTAP